ncbi:MAG: gamma-glutamylcyclotransferase [Polaromonas sp.]|nr:gamma-glutamylcyclotransferase [Polaromonas sp.]
MTNLPAPLRDPAPMLERALDEWGGQQDLWIFGYGSLIWKPDFDYAERRPAKVHGWHRALKMWSRINRGTPECPGLVFALLSGGSCHGVVYRVPRHEVAEVVARLWLREMVTGVYDPRLLRCNTDKGPLQALAFTLSRRSPNFTGELTEARYREIFSVACGRYGSTHDYARQTLESLQHHGISDAALARLLNLASRPTLQA